MIKNFLQCTYQSANLPRIHVKPEDFIKIVDEINNVIIFRESYTSVGKRLSLTGYAGDKEPDIFIIKGGIIISTDASLSITNLEEFKTMLLEK